MMSIPVWIFVLMLILSLASGGAMLLMIGAWIVGIFLDRNAKKHQQKPNNCPDFINKEND